ncbi:hypothetical protein N7540_007007 [Penicillium herquei]|nr:hypothetical protein N7540_007007 [Penicillium herquei]
MLSSAKSFSIWQQQLRTAILAEDPKIWDVLTGELEEPECIILTPTLILEIIKDQFTTPKPKQDIFRKELKAWMAKYTRENIRPHDQWLSMNKRALSHLNRSIDFSMKESIGLAPTGSAFETYSAVCKFFEAANLTASEAWERLKKCKYLPNSTPGPSSHAFVDEWKKALADFTKLAQDSNSAEKPLPQLSAYIMFLDAVANNPETESWLRVHRFSPYNLDVLEAVYEDFLKGERRRELWG